MLRLNGYSTAAFGKSHETAAWEVSPSGPTDRWPTRSDFYKFYGFIGGETNQWAPLLYDGMIQVAQSTDPNYHFMTDISKQAVAWVRYQKSLTPDKPFFMYFASDRPIEMVCRDTVSRLHPVLRDVMSKLIKPRKRAQP